MKIKRLLIVAITATLLPQLSIAGSLENLERERALTVMEMIDGKLSAEERWQRLSAAKRRLADLERIVLNDKNLRGKTSNLVKRSFQSFELTFLAHASVETQSSIQGHWFDQVGMSTDDLMSTRVSK